MSVYFNSAIQVNTLKIFNGNSSSSIKKALKTVVVKAVRSVEKTISCVALAGIVLGFAADRANANYSFDLNSEISIKTVYSFNELCFSSTDGGVLVMDDENGGVTINGQMPADYGSVQMGFSLLNAGVITFVGYASNDDTSTSHPEWGSADPDGVTGFYYNSLSQDETPTGLWAIFDANSDGIGSVESGVWTLGDDDVLYAIGATTTGLNNIALVGDLPAYDSAYIYSYNSEQPDSYVNLPLPGINLVTGIPEPATLVLLGTGLVASILARRKK